MSEQNPSQASVPFKGAYTDEALAQRREWASQITQADLSPLAHEYPLPADTFKGNIENHIGFVQIPIGLAGPVLIHGGFAKGHFYVPMATTEGALIASCSRGARAVTESGGAYVRVVSDQMMRAPMFTFHSLVDAARFVDWIHVNEDQIKQAAEGQSRVAKLLKIDPISLGDTVCVQLSYYTGDAYGANMVMKCSWAACQYILQRFPADTGATLIDWYVDSQLGAEKKVNAMTYSTSLRGKRVVAEVHLKRNVMENILKVSPEDLYEAFAAGIAPNIAACSIGCNVNFANTVAAIFTATGQDIATVPESCQGQLNFRLDDDGMYFGVMMPGVVVATIGGGTALPSQKAALEIIGCFGPGHARKLAEITAVMAMCLDLSTFSAIASDHFVQAHERLGRNRPRTGPLGSAH